MFSDLIGYFVFRLALGAVLMAVGTGAVVEFLGADEPEFYTAIMDYGAQVRYLAQR